MNNCLHVNYDANKLKNIWYKHTKGKWQKKTLKATFTKVIKILAKKSKTMKLGKFLRTTLLLY
jgi:hypothetical protein